MTSFFHRLYLMGTEFSFNREQFAALLSGATAGVCVDMAVYPMDTIKTRLQSAAHAVKPVGGGRMGLFAGLPAVLLGSAPGAALFFISYETVKRTSLSSGAPLWMASMLSACTGELIACIVRVPAETIKQRTQNQPHLNVRIVLSQSLKSEGWRGLYRGYWSQVSRGLPFSLIQYPIWELLKCGMEQYNRCQTPNISLLDFEVGKECFSSSNESASLSKKQFAVCGAIAGAISGSSTTPLDVAKTRIMLAEKGTPLASGSVAVALRTIYREGGVSGLFAGLMPRIYIKCFGGAVFLGLYDISKRMWLAYLPTKSFDAN
ncbi:S-adenosylmethionine mitochondrial carrier protein [Taenia crassiceps]|uniref:S-adenosylmethionine mitochondrial carrier protein n=1 Tax=Taenia crassiceps TaxID=6207 RepID=A0ABR4QKN5_9CEST